MAEASQGVTRDQLVWTADAYIREETYWGALARIIDAHHALPIAALWASKTDRYEPQAGGANQHIASLTTPPPMPE